ncbi:tetratricopeptide repeat protein [bacterium]|nr:tetratricopeptide repeat protein [bacterium]
MRIFNKILLLLLLLLSAGCGPQENKSIDLVEQGVKYMESEQYDKALEYYKEAIKLNPESENAYLQMALLYDEYFNDKTNAVHAYIQYLKISKNEINKKKVEKWIGVATKEIGKAKTPFSIGDSMAQDGSDSSYALREKQFDAIRRQLIDKYESKIDVLKNELFNTENKCAELSNENIILRSDDKNSQIAGLLITIASNESITATLQTQIESDKREANASLQAQKTLQSIITNLQASLNLRSDRDNSVTELIKSNEFLLIRNSVLQNEMKNVMQDDKLLKIQMAALKKKYAHKTSSSRNSAAAKTTIPLTPELLQAFESAKKELVELKRRERFNRQERRKFIETISSLRVQISNENSDLERGTKAVAEVKQLKIELDRERSAVKHRKKQLYDRTLQLKKMQQSYLSLRKQYLSEIRKSQKNNSVVTDVKKEILDTTPVSSSKREYIVKSGDSLAKISEKMYGDKNKYKIIYNANKATLKKASRLKVGQVLIIP